MEEAVWTGLATILVCVNLDSPVITVRATSTNVFLHHAMLSAALTASSWRITISAAAALVTLVSFVSFDFVSGIR